MRRVSATVVVVGVVAFLLGMLVGGRTSGLFSRKPPDPAPASAAPPATVVLDGLNLGAILVDSKPANAVLTSNPRFDVLRVADVADDESNLPFAQAVAEWSGPTDVLEVRNAFLNQLRKHYEKPHLIVYGPGIRSADKHPDSALELFRCDAPDGTCAAMVALAIHVRGDRCRVAAQLFPTRPWRAPK